MKLNHLQKELRHFVLKPLTKAVHALEEVGSNMTDLRAQIHYEVAICELEVEDILSKAKLHIGNGR